MPVPQLNTSAQDQQAPVLAVADPKAADMQVTLDAIAAGKPAPATFLGFPEGVPVPGAKTTNPETTAYLASAATHGQQLDAVINTIIPDTLKKVQEASTAIEAKTAESALLLHQVGLLQAERIGNETLRVAAMREAIKPDAVLNPLYAELAKTATRLSDVDKALALAANPNTPKPQGFIAGFMSVAVPRHLNKERDVLLRQIQDLQTSTHNIQAAMQDSVATATAMNTMQTKTELQGISLAKLDIAVAELKKQGIDTAKLELELNTVALNASGKAAELAQKAVTAPLEIKGLQQRLQAGELELASAKLNVAEREAWIAQTSKAMQILGYTGDITPEKFKLLPNDLQDTISKITLSGTLGDSVASVVKNMAQANVANMDSVVVHTVRSFLAPQYSAQLAKPSVAALASKPKQQEAEIARLMTADIQELYKRPISWNDTSDPRQRAAIPVLLKEPGMLNNPIAKGLATRFGATPAETVVKDEQIVDAVASMVSGKELSAGEASAAAASFYKNAIAFNNRMKKPGMIKLPEQVDYRISLPAATTSFGGLVYSAGTLDLTSPAAWTNLLALRNARAAVGMPTSIPELLTGSK